MKDLPSTTISNDISRKNTHPKHQFDKIIIVPNVNRSSSVFEQVLTKEQVVHNIDKSPISTKLMSKSNTSLEIPNFGNELVRSDNNSHFVVDPSYSIQNITDNWTFVDNMNNKLVGVNKPIDNTRSITISKDNNST